MSEFKFADRYAEAGLKPSAELINLRSETAERITSGITNQFVLDLAAAYYGSPDVDLSWLKDEFAKEDASFSLVNNEREMRVLAAVMLGQLIAQGNSVAILSVTIGNVTGKRRPPESEWLVAEAKEALGRASVSARAPKKLETKIVPTSSKDLAKEIAQNDWAILLTTLGKISSEAQLTTKDMASQTTGALRELSRQMSLMREESQMLWWLFGGHSRALERSFSTMAPPQAALVGAVDLGTLTTFSSLGPVAAPAMLERVIALAKKPKGPPSRELSTTIDTFATADLAFLQVFHTKLPPRLAPITTAIDLACTIGTGVWYSRFKALTGFEASIEFNPLPLAEQLYWEHLLEKLL